MLRHFQPFIDYAEIIKRDANQQCYRLSKNEIKATCKKSPKTKANVKKLKLGRR